MRSVADLTAEINATAKRLKALRQERDEARIARDRRIVAMFQANKSAVEIAAAERLPANKIRMILSDHGCTIRGREAIRAYRASLGDGREGARP